MELEEPLGFGNGVLPGCMDTQNSSRSYGHLIATGYGLKNKWVVDSDSRFPVGIVKFSRFLKELDYEDISSTEQRCLTYKDGICADSKSAGTEESICFGDEGKFSFILFNLKWIKKLTKSIVVGGPLHKTENGKTTIVGIGMKVDFILSLVLVHQFDLNFIKRWLSHGGFNK